MGNRLSEPTFKYDEASDSLYVSFAPGENATGIELSEHILLRINKAERRAVGLTLFNYSVLAQPTELGFRSLPLVGLDALPPDVRELVFDILRTPQVRGVLSLSTYMPSAAEAIPIATLQQSLLPRQAA